MKKTVLTVGLVVVVLLGIGYVYAAGPGFGPGYGRGNCAGGLNLTSDQQSKMNDLRQQHYSDMAPLRDRMFALRQELRTLWSDPKADAGVIKAKTEEMTTLRNQMQEKMVEMRLECRNLLTPDQVQTMGEGCGRGPGGGAGWGRGPGMGRGRV